MTTDFIEKFCVIAEQDGFPRIAGRIMGFLLLHEGPYTLDELADELQISKTSASTNARLLEQHGIIERVVKAGDRRDFYHLGSFAGIGYCRARISADTNADSAWRHTLAESAGGIGARVQRKRRDSPGA